MDSHDPQHLGPGGTTGGARDLWKTVLDEVATDAAARRARMLQKQGDKRATIELDLLKRILIAVEARGDQSIALKRILEAVQSAQPTDLSAPLKAIEQGIDALAKKLAPRPRKPSEDADTANAISKAVVDALQPLLAAPSAEETREALIREIGQMLQQRSAEQAAQIKHDLAEQLAKLPPPPAPPPLPPPPVLPPDPTPKLDAILQAVQSPAAGQHAQQIAKEQNALLQSILATVERAPDQTQANLLRDLAGRIDALPRPADLTPQLAAILDELKRRPSTDHSESLRQITGQLEQLAAVREQAAKLDAISAALADMPRQDSQPLLQDVLALVRSPRTDESLHAKLDAALAAAKPDASPQLLARLDELLAQLRVPKVDPHAELLARIHEAVTRKPEPPVAAPDLGPRFDELMTRMATQESLRPFEARLDQIASETKARAGRDEELLTRMLGEARDNRAASEAAFEKIAAELGRSLADSQATIAARIEAFEAFTRSHAESLAQSHQQLFASSQAAAASQSQGNEKLDAILEAVRKPADPHVAATLDQILDVLTSQPAPAAPDAAALGAASAAAAAPLFTGLREDVRVAADSLRKQVEALAAGVKMELHGQAAALNERLAAQDQNIAQQLERKDAEDRRDASALREELNQVTQAIRALPAPAESAPAQPQAPAADPRQLELLHEILGEVRAPAARARQEQALDEIAAGIREQPAHQQEQARKLAGEIRQLADANRQTQQTLQRVLEAVSARRDPIVVSAPASAAPASAPAPVTLAPAQPMAPPVPSTRPYAWPGATPPRSRVPAAAIYAATAAAIGIFVLMLINTFADRTPKPPAPAGNLAQNGNGTGTTPQPNIPEIVKTPPVTDNGKTTANVNATKDGGAGANKDGDKPIVDISKALLPKQPITDGDGKSLVSPTVADLLKDAINKPRGVLAFDQATQVVLLFHATGASAAENTALLAELKTALGKLRDGQKYTVIFTEGDRPVEVPPAGLKAATDRERAFTDDWIGRNMTGDTVRPGNNPIAAIDLAMGLEPDLLWLFTDGQPSGKPGQITAEELIQKFKSANARGRTHIYATVATPSGPLAPAVADAHRLLKLLTQEHGGAFGALGAVPEKPTGGP